MLITAIIFLALALVALVLWKTIKLEDRRRDYSTNEVIVTRDKTPNRIAGGVAAGLLAGTLLFIGLACVYTQDPGEANVQRSWTGEVVGQTTEEGLHVKAPWVDTVTYDIRNQQVIFANPTGDEPQNANGPQITVQDREGVTANIDITVRYSVDPEAITGIYQRYQSQENFVSRFIENDIRAGVRTIPAQYGTLELLNNRGEVEQKIREFLEERWAAEGVRAESVSLQEIRYSDDVKARFDEAQNARTAIEVAQAELEATEVAAQQKIVQAEAEAEANDTLSASLSDRVLQQRYLDTLAELAEAGNLVVVPEGFNGLVNVNRD